MNKDAVRTVECTRLQGKRRPAWLRYAAAEEYTGLGRTTLSKLVRDGRVRAARLGKHVIINRESLDEYLERQSS